MPNRLKVLLAEDEEIDYLCVKRAADAAIHPTRLLRVTDGDEALKYLQGDGVYADRSTFPIPNVLVLDLKMPRKSGFDVLQWVRDHEIYRTIPVIIFSTSGLEREVERAYSLGANTYFVKPMAVDDFTKLCDLMVHYWKAANLPAA